MNFNNNRPVYQQIADLLKDRIIKGEYKPGYKLPSVRFMAKELMVNPNTVQRAYRELEGIDLILTKKNSGSFITDDVHSINTLRETISKDFVFEFSQKMKNIGYDKKGIVDAVEKLVEED